MTRKGNVKCEYYRKCLAVYISMRGHRSGVTNENPLILSFCLTPSYLMSPFLRFERI